MCAARICLLTSGSSNHIYRMSDWFFGPRRADFFFEAGSTVVSPFLPNLYFCVPGAQVL